VRKQERERINLLKVAGESKIPSQIYLIPNSKAISIVYAIQ
jgi:hypothetical protein